MNRKTRVHCLELVCLRAERIRRGKIPCLLNASGFHHLVHLGKQQKHVNSRFMFDTTSRMFVSFIYLFLEMKLQEKHHDSLTKKRPCLEKEAVFSVNVIRLSE